MKWLKIKMPLSCQNCPVIDGRLTVECPYTQITTINVYLLIEIQYNILLQCHGNYIEVGKFNVMLENDILRNCSRKTLGVLTRVWLKWVSGRYSRPEICLADPRLTIIYHMRSPENRPEKFSSVNPCWRLVFEHLGVQMTPFWLRLFLKGYWRAYNAGHSTRIHCYRSGKRFNSYL